MAWEHGTTNGYTKHRCRCDVCREAWRVYRAAYTARRSAAHPCPDCGGPKDYRAERCDACYHAAVAPCGTAKRYQNGCRCDACRAAATAKRRAHRHANPEAARAYDRERKRRAREQATA